MSSYFIYPLGGCAVCPECSGRVYLREHDIFPKVGFCVDCNQTFYLIREGNTEREWYSETNFDEALKELNDDTEL